jgi:hypothetical protein
MRTRPRWTQKHPQLMMVRMTRVTKPKKASEHRKNGCGDVLSAGDDGTDGEAVMGVPASVSVSVSAPASAYAPASVSTQAAEEEEESDADAVSCCIADLMDTDKGSAATDASNVDALELAVGEVAEAAVCAAEGDVGERREAATAGAAEVGRAGNSTACVGAVTGWRNDGETAEAGAMAMADRAGEGVSGSELLEAPSLTEATARSTKLT